MKDEITVVFVVTVLALGGAMAVSSAYRPNSAGSTITGQFNPVTRLEFTMSLNSSTVARGNSLAVSLNLFNTLDRANNVTGSSDWRLTNKSEEWPGHWNCAQNDVFRIEVVSGYYDRNNFTGGAPLQPFNLQFPPGVNGTNLCLYFVRPANNTAPPLSVPWYGQNYYVFTPKSNAAQWVTSSQIQAFCASINGTYHPCINDGQRAVMNETMILKPAQFSNSTGVFTIVGGDEWGDLEVAHFVWAPT
ncbi:MAG: hypothetical protein KGI38_01975 [Thaumarchaeota archaeon]|nr:hypothetical protein [Nitrososphaerota archaeon]